MSKQRIPGADPRHSQPIEVRVPHAHDPIASVLRDTFDADDALPADLIELLSALDAKSRSGGGESSHN